MRVASGPLRESSPQPAPGAAIVTVHVDPAPEDRAAIAGLPDGATILVISRSPLVMSFAAALRTSRSSGSGSSASAAPYPINNRLQSKVLNIIISL